MTKSDCVRGIAVVAAAFLVVAAPLGAQRRATASSSSDWCAEQNWGDDRKGFCEVREYTAPAAGGEVTVDGAPNGGIAVEGSSRSDILIRARVVATADTEEEARSIASRVQVTATAVRVDSDGPRNLGNRQSWQVSY